MVQNSDSIRLVVAAFWECVMVVLGRTSCSTISITQYTGKYQPHTKDHITYNIAHCNPHFPAYRVAHKNVPNFGTELYNTEVNKTKYIFLVSEH